VNIRPAYVPHGLATLALKILALLPMLLLALFGSMLGQLSYVFDRRRHAIVRRNLEACFPDMTRRARRRLARRNFRALARATLCSIAIAWFNSEVRLRHCVVVRGAHRYRAALRNGRPVILMAPHFIGLEIGWLRIALETPMVCMYREPRAHLFHWAVHRHRLRFGGIAIERGAHLRRLIRLVREGHTFYYLPDIDPGKRAPHVFAPFFDKPAATVTALGRIAQMTQGVVIPCVTRELGWGRYEIEFQAPLENFPSGDPQADATHMNAVIENAVRASPAQYLWVHRRFKTRPRGAPRFYG
jgi:KDO2-lipid IV(A) lauroyltransferase